jgi:5'-methylthioadenosine phosphorylase
MIGVIGGTGLGEALFGAAGGQEHQVDTPFGPPSSPIRVVQWNGLDVAMLARHGTGHVYNPSQVPYRANIYALKALGCTHIIASGAVGSLREELQPRHLVVVDQVIDKTSRRTPTYFDDGLAVHVEFAEPFCRGLRELLCSVADKADTRVHAKGTYVCMEGPAFSTVAESNMHRAWGGDLIGMTAMPEAKLAREAEIAYALVALVTDYDCWKPHPANQDRDALLREILGHLHAATTNAINLIRAAIEKFAEAPLPPSPIHNGLDLAVWSTSSALTPAVVKRYGVLLERYMRDRQKK